MQLFRIVCRRECLGIAKLDITLSKVKRRFSCKKPIFLGYRILLKAGYMCNTVQKLGYSRETSVTREGHLSHHFATSFDAHDRPLVAFLSFPGQLIVRERALDSFWSKRKQFIAGKHLFTIQKQLWMHGQTYFLIGDGLIGKNVVQSVELGSDGV